MRLRTMALVAGALGVLVLVAGLIADATRADVVATPTAPVETAVVVLEPETLALAPEGRITVNGAGSLNAHAARPVDAQAWLATTSATYVTGLVDWENLRVRTSDRVEPLEPSPSPSPEPTDGVTPSPEPTVDATPTPEATDDATTDDPAQADAEIAPPMSADHWRVTWNENDSFSISVADIPAGMPLVVRSADGSPLTDVSIRIERDLNDGWIAPLIWWGIILTALGAIASLFLVIDIRPVQERTETWLADRRRGAASSASIATPGTRRARRATGESMPVADLGEDPANQGDAATPAQDDTATKPDEGTETSKEDRS